MTPFGVRRRGRALLRRLAVRADSNFKFSFSFLDAQQRDGLEAVYRFCRAVDDIVDERPHGPVGEAVARAQLAGWRRAVDTLYGVEGSVEDELDASREASTAGATWEAAAPDPAIASQLAAAIEQFDIPREPLVEVIRGCAMDLDRSEYETLEQLEIYCYRVASCVGFACLPIFGNTTPDAHEFAHHLGLGMQYTNILRDVGEDAAEGRVYIPLEFLEAADLGVHDLKIGVYDARFARVARHMDDLARAHYAKAWAALERAPKAHRLVAAEIMGRTYAAILDAVEAVDWDVFTRRVKIRRRDKLRIAASVLARAATPRIGSGAPPEAEASSPYSSQR